MTRHLRFAFATGALAFVALAPLSSSTSWASAQRHHKVHHPIKRVSALSGKWSGTYSGSYSGLFRLTWQESGTSLTGIIVVSGFGDVPTPIHGTVAGATIRFGTVGSEALTYSGSVSGSSMSGTWQIDAGGKLAGGGSWKASKSG